MKKHKIYLLTFPNGKQYCGYTSRSLEERWKSNGRGYIKCPLVWKAIKKYGWNNVVKELLYSFDNESEALLKEREIIKEKNLTNPDNGYNLHEGGQPTGAAQFFTEESRKKLSRASKARWQDPEYRAKMLKRKVIPHKFTQEELERSKQTRRSKIAHNARAVLQIDIQSHQIINEFTSATKAAITVAGNEKACSNILAVCKGKRRTAYGFLWRFKNDENISI